MRHDGSSRRDIAAMRVTSSCRLVACGTVVDGRVETCPKCGSLTLSSHRLRRRGWVLLLGGLFLAGFVVGIPLIARLTLGPTVDFDAPMTLQETITLAAPVGLIGLFGVVSAAAGGFQVATGRRLRHAHVVMVALVAAIVLVFWIASAIDGSGVRPLPRRMSLP